MLPTLSWGDRASCRGPLVVMCHWLGGSAQSWSLVAERLAERGMRCVAVDLPGFGAAADGPGYSLREMADAVIATIRTERSAEEPGAPWLLAGHSMGGSVAAIVARDAANGADGLGGLRGVVLVSPSPPGPEPMKESKRQEMLDSLGQSAGDEKNREHAIKFVEGNVGKPALGEATLRDAVEGTLRMNRAALRAWLESGTKEDWREFVGELPLPALVFAGTEDAELGPDVQRELTLPHFRKSGVHMAGELVVLEGAGHLGPLERPGAIADRVVDFCVEIGLSVRRQVNVSERFDGLIMSDLTSPQTRAVMRGRLLEEDAVYEPEVVGRHGLRVLRELARQVVPGAAFDLASRADQRLAHGSGDGWRPAELPEDATAWTRGLASLDAAARREHGTGFAELSDEWQQTLLDQASAGKLGKGIGERVLHAVGVDLYPDEVELYSGAEMQRWFEEVCGELAKLYMADPRTMERIGFAGFADEHGFTQIRLGEREVWER